MNSWKVNLAYLAVTIILSACAGVLMNGMPLLAGVAWYNAIWAYLQIK